LCRVDIVLLTTTVVVDVCVVMRREGKGTGQMIDGGVSNKILPLTELQIPANNANLNHEWNAAFSHP